ncbi:MAG: chromophore lyase CpcT/CpeT [Krumholzibacteria bacterium]|nr:chromophore lyase CpcT/CpeT [Candidatus Krumholzibacteria bacterium]
MRSGAIPAFALACCLAAVLVPAGAGAADDTDFVTLVAWMSGAFSSAAQAEADSAFQDIRLRMKPIWTSRDDGAWFYVEQAVAWAQDKPYRQRVYRVRDLGGGRFASETYTLPDDAAAAGAWRLDQPLQEIGPDDLAAREGCVVYLERRADGVFAGGTRGRECTSSLRGATWASTEIEIGPGGMTSWDRGWNDAGGQVWGSEHGGYVFLRQ